MREGEWKEEREKWCERVGETGERAREMEG